MVSECQNWELHSFGSSACSQESFVCLSWSHRLAQTGRDCLVQSFVGKGAKVIVGTLSSCILKTCSDGDSTISLRRLFQGVIHCSHYQMLFSYIMLCFCPMSVIFSFTHFCLVLSGNEPCFFLFFLAGKKSAWVSQLNSILFCCLGYGSGTFAALQNSHLGSDGMQRTFGWCRDVWGWTSLTTGNGASCSLYHQ